MAFKQHYRSDPVLRLHIRCKTIETGNGLRTRRGVPIKLDQGERTVMSELGADDVSAAVSETEDAMWCALDLHAHHHFT